MNILTRFCVVAMILGSWNSAVTEPTRHRQTLPQSPEVVEAYKLVETFMHTLGENIDFGRAYEATFPRDERRRRAIAIADGDFGDIDYSRIDNGILIRAYKMRMQIFYLALPLGGPDKHEEDLFFPTDIKHILDRKSPSKWKDFPAYVNQLSEDVTQFRVHIGDLLLKSKTGASRIKAFKADAVAYSKPPPTDFRVGPMRGYVKDGVIGKDADYYEIDGFVVAKVEGKMRIIGIRPFSRMF